MKRKNRTSASFIAGVGMVPIAALGWSGVALAAEATAATQSTVELQQALPEATIHSQRGRISRILGKAMTTGDSPEASADAFRVKAAKGLSAVPGEVRRTADPNKLSSKADGEGTGLMLDAATGKYKFYLFRYGQARAGVPVFDSELQTLVKNEAGFPVVWASSSLRDLKSFAPAAATTAAYLDETKTRAAIAGYAAGKGKATGTPSAFSRIGKAEQVIFAGAGDSQQAPRMAQQFIAENDNPPAKVKFIVDAQTGEVLHSVKLLRDTNVGGTINGISTVGPRAYDPADTACAATASTPMPWAEVRRLGDTTPTYTSNTGYYYVINSGDSPVTLVSPIQGRYFAISDAATTVESLNLTVTPPNAADFLHNAANTSEFIRAEAMAYTHVNRVRDFLLGYLPTFPGVSTTENFPVQVNYGGAGCPNAWGGSGGLTFCRQTGSAKNAAFGAIIYHEFGHAIIDFAGGASGPYHEGMADSISTSLDEVAGYGFGWGTNNCSTPDRMMQNSVQFDAVNCSSVGSESHACGTLLAGVIYDIRQQLMASNPSTYRDILNPIMFSSIPMNGGTDINANLIEDFLSLDDDDGNLNNGTPHRAEICQGFALHGITSTLCPTPALNPCDGVCTSPTSFTWSGSYWSGELGTGSVCRETTQAIVGGNCGNLTGGRTLSVNGQVMTCDNQNWSSIPAPVRGGYCVTTTPGDYSYAYFQLW